MIPLHSGVRGMSQSNRIASHSGYSLATNGIQNKGFAACHPPVQEPVRFEITSQTKHQQPRKNERQSQPAINQAKSMRLQSYSKEGHLLASLVSQREVESLSVLCVSTAAEWSARAGGLFREFVAACEVDVLSSGVTGILCAGKGWTGDKSFCLC
jgi:hypothetical protein